MSWQTGLSWSGHWRGAARRGGHQAGWSSTGPGVQRMTTKRTPLRRDARVRITPEMLALWAKLHEIAAEDGGYDEWEPGGRRREFLDTSGELNRALGVKPWEQCPFFTDGPEPPAHKRDPWRAALWTKAWDLRCALDAAARSPRE